MFEGFARVWTPVLQSAALGKKPVGLKLAGQPIVLFRGPGGQPGALIDQCPHRGVALSLGRVQADGCLECPFHGWRFSASGQNTHVPFNPSAKREQLGATPLPVREIGDLIWIYTAPGITAPVEPQVPYSLSDPRLARIYLTRQWNCHWTRAMENMLDSPHLPFVHRTTIGARYRKVMGPDSSMEITWEDTAFGGRTKAILDGRDNGSWLEFYRPNVMVLHIPHPKRHLRIHALVMPVDENHTTLTVAASRDFLKHPVLNGLFASLNGKIADEDRDVVESSQPREVPPAATETSVATDRATLQFRKYYYETLRPSTA